MKVQAFATGLVNHVVFDFVGRDRLIAQITSNSYPVSRIDLGGQRKRQSAVVDALQDAGV